MVNKAVFLCGPTASGKTQLALDLASYYPCEIISVDSTLIYQGLDIGSAKPTSVELAQVPHHLIDIRSPLETYSVAEFLADCNHLISAINLRGKLPILVGGTMMYYNALINGLSELPPSDPAVRSELMQRLSQHGVASLYSQLEQLDPQAAQRINPNDTQRLLRALEVYYLSGKPLSQAQEEAWRPGLINCQTLPLAILPEERKVLHERIDNRFVQMLEAGFISEVTNLRQRFPQLSATHNAMRSVGYRQVWEYLDGKCDYATLIATGQAASRQLAKRQITWLRSMPIIAMASSTLTSYELLPKIRAHIDSFLSGESV